MMLGLFAHLDWVDDKVFGHRWYFLCRYSAWGLHRFDRPGATLRDLAEKARSWRAIQPLVQALATGGYDAPPGKLRDGDALIVEDLAPVMKCVTFYDPTWTPRENARRLDRLAHIARFFFMKRRAERYEAAAAHWHREVMKAGLRLWKP